VLFTQLIDQLCEDFGMRFHFYILAAVVACALGATSAEASRRSDTASSGGEWWSSSIRGSSSEASAEDRGSKSGRRSTRASKQSSDDDSRSGSSSSSSSGRSSGLGPRPNQWCGWWMRTQRGGGPEYNLAWNWTKYGSPGSPQVGAVVVWRHHVGEITGRAANGQWIVKSGNDGGRVRERARSISGAVIRV
jgi:hypothetical protein